MKPLFKSVAILAVLLIVIAHIAVFVYCTEFGCLTEIGK